MNSQHLVSLVCYIAMCVTFILYLLAGPTVPAKDPEVCYQWHVYKVVLNVRATNIDDVSRQFDKLGRPDKAFICPWDSVENKK